jgi:hypothetical protein
VQLAMPSKMTCYDFKNIIAKKIGEKTAFRLKTKLNYEKN